MTKWTIIFITPPSITSEGSMVGKDVEDNRKNEMLLSSTRIKQNPP
jgi:hypothetical protein